MTITVRINGQYADTDADTRIGLQWKSWLFARNGMETSRSFGFSLPDTPDNNKMFIIDRDPNFYGVRHAAKCEIVAGGVVLHGRAVLTSWGGGRYEILFMYGDLDLPGNFGDSLHGHLFTGATFEFTGKDRAVTGQMLHDFGFYSYNNGTAQTPDVGYQPGMFPTVNLGWLIEQAAANVGYSVAMPSNSIRDPHRYGLVLPTMDVDKPLPALRVTGSARAGWSPVFPAGYSQLSEFGLKVETRRYKRGYFPANVTVYVFVAIRPITISYTGSLSLPWFFVSGQGDDLWNWSDDGNNVPEASECASFERELAVGDWFAIVSSLDVHALPFFRPWCWDGQTGYTGAVDCTFTVKEAAGVVQAGQTVTLDDNMPDLSFTQLLQAACDLTDCILEVDGAAKTVTLHPSPDILNGWNWLDLDTAGVTEVKEVLRYIEGLSRHNYVRCKSADYVREEMMFRRDFPCDNDALDEEAEFSQIPFNEGNWEVTDGVKVAQLEDVTVGANGDYAYKGVLTVIYENTTLYGNGNALHVQTVNDEGLGAEMAEASREAVSVRLTARVPLRLFAALAPGALAVWRGRRWHVRTATWSDGLADLELLSLNS